MYFSRVKIFLVTFFILILNSLQLNALETISLQLSWKHQFEYAGFYTAKEKGFYKEVGLDVTFKEMSFELKDSVIEDVLSGRTTYAIDYSSIIKSYMDGNPLVFVANFVKQSPLVIATQEDIHMPSDLVGKRFMGGYDALKNTSILLMLKKFGINKQSFINVPQTFNMDDFINKKVDATTIFLTNQAYILEQQGYKYNILSPERYGAEFYVDNVFTSLQELEKYPHRVKAFKEASIKGWKYALANKEEIIKLILEKYNTQNKTKAQYEYEANQIENLILPSIYPIGSINEERVKRIANSYKQLGIVDKNITIDFNKFIFEKEQDESLLSDEHKSYLQKKERIKLCIDPNWMPFEKIEQGEHIGLSKDYFKIFQKHLPIPIELVKTKSWVETLENMKTKRCDIISMAMQTPQREAYLAFTKPYVSVPLVLATKLNVPFIDDLQRLKDRQIGIIKGHAYGEIFKRKYNNFTIVDVNNTQDGLQKVAAGELFGFIDTLATIGYQFQKNYTGELKIASKFDEKLYLSVAIRKDEPLLGAVFNRLIDDVDKSKRQEILNRHIAITYENSTDYKLAIQLGVASFLIFCIILYWNRRLHIEKSKTENALYELRLAEKLLEEKNMELTKISITDKLTGIYNRSKLDENLQKELARSERNGDLFAVIMLDIDHFKAVNDNFGHQVGDEVLVTIAKILHKNLRKIDTLGRWGGEEFLILCPHTNKEGGIEKAQRLRKLIESYNFKGVGQKTASFGVAIYRQDDTEKSIIHRVDTAMYQAKNNGRNQVVFEIS